MATSTKINRCARSKTSTEDTHGKTKAPRQTVLHQKSSQAEVQQQNRPVVIEKNLPFEESIRSDPEWFDAQLTMTVLEISFSQAVSSPDRDEWRNAVYTEIKSLVDTWTIVDRSCGKKVIGCRTVLRNIYKVSRELERWKARIVAKGFSQRPGVDFHDTFAPVARLSSLRTLMAASVEQGMLISQIDITSFLNGTMDTLVYMETPKMLQETLERIVATEHDTILTEKARKILSLLKEGIKVCKLNI